MDLRCSSRRKCIALPLGRARLLPESIPGWKVEERPRKKLLPKRTRAMTGCTTNARYISMPIRKHLTDKTAFGPAAIEAMSKAFEEACIALQVFAGDEKGREIIATRIIDLARNGLIDPTALRDRVIAEAQLSE